MLGGGGGNRERKKKKSVKGFMNTLSKLTIMQASPFSQINTQKEYWFTITSNVLVLSPTKNLILKDKKQMCLFIFTFNNAYPTTCVVSCAYHLEKKLRGINSREIN